MKQINNLLIIFILTSIPYSVCSQYSKVQSSGLDVCYRVFGEGTPLVILGGGPGDNADRYLSLCNLLSKDFRCILIDQRGTGMSLPSVYDSTTINIALTLSDLEAIRKSLGLNEWNILGFSYGGFLASVYAETYPASVSALIALGSMGFDFSVFRYFNDNITYRLQPCDKELIEFWSDSAKVAENPHHAMVETIRAMMPGYFYDRKKSLIVSQDMKDSDFDFSMGDWIWQDIQKHYMELNKSECSFKRPVLILQGRQDPMGESVALSLSHQYPNSKLVFIERCGHYSWIEQPDTVLVTIKEFLLSTE